MKLEQSFEVDAPLDRVWSALIDVRRVAPCLPGAELSEGDEEGTYAGTFSVKLGPTTASYRGTLTVEEVDEGAHRATMRANGTDKRGQGGAKATIVSTLRERDGGGTIVDVSTDYAITGRLARFGRGGMIQDVSNRLLREFASCLAETLGQEPASADPPPGAEDVPPAAPPPSEDAPAGAAAGAGSAAPAGGPPPAGAAAPPPPRPAAAPRPAKPISGFRLLLGALGDRLRRLLARRRRS